MKSKANIRLKVIKNELSGTIFKMSDNSFSDQVSNSEFCTTR